MPREQGPIFKVGDAFLRVEDLQWMVDRINDLSSTIPGDGILLQQTGGGTVVAFDEDLLPAPVVVPQVAWRARVTGYGAANREFTGRRLRPDLTDFDEEDIAIKVFRYEGTVGVDDLREMVPFVEPSLATPPPRKAQVCVIPLPAVIDPGPPQVHDTEWYLNWGTIGTCQQGAADQRTRPIIKTAVVEVLRILELVGFDAEKLAEAKRLLPQCCGGDGAD